MPMFGVAPYPKEPFEIGTPSITKSGELFPEIEPSPRILIEDAVPGLPEIVLIRNPATRPLRA